jgi:hypothetical protein
VLEASACFLLNMHCTRVTSRVSRIEFQLWRSLHELEDVKAREAAAVTQVRPLLTITITRLLSRACRPLAQLDRLSFQVQEAKRAGIEGDQYKAQLQAQVPLRDILFMWLSLHRIILHWDEIDCFACDIARTHINLLQQGGYQSRVFFVANCAQSLVQVTAMAAALKKAEDDKQVLLHQHAGHACCIAQHY